MKVIKIGAKWCIGCLVMAPRWLDVEKENAWLETKFLDYDEDREEVLKYGVDKGKIPVFIFLDRDENEIFRTWGEISKKDIIKLINEYKDR